MPLKKPKKNLKVSVLVPCYKRSEYTNKCIKALNHGKGEVEYEIFQHNGESGLRQAIIEFIDNHRDYDFLAKMDNDCVVPIGWMDQIIDIFDKSDVDILSPNVFPSDAANVYGKKVPGLIYMPASFVGGLWIMKGELIRDMEFVNYDVNGIRGAIALLRQIKNEKNPIIGWTKEVLIQDIGHWSGNHPDHIKSEEHQNYSFEVGREIAWRAI